MHVLLRNLETGQYFAGGDIWVADSASAEDFRELESALRMLSRQKVARAEVVLKLANIGEEVVLTVGGARGTGETVHVEAARVVTQETMPTAINIAGGILGPGKKVLLRLGSAARQHEFRQSESVLTARETEILQLIGKGRSYKQIAGCLRLSINTVSNHLANVRQKLGAHSVIEALLLAGWNRKAAGPEQQSTETRAPGKLT